MSKKKYFQLHEKMDTMKKVSEIGNSDVIRCGLKSLDEIIGFKKGYPVFIGGAPFSGKTEICLEWLVNLSIERGYKWFCYLGEGGSIENVFLELIHKYLGKPYSHATEKEKFAAEGFVEQCFVIANDDLDFMITGFYDAVAEAEKELGIKFDGTMFDPFNDVEEEMLKFNNRDDKFLAYALKQVRVSSKVNKRIDFIINHIADVKAIQDKETGNFYMRAALPNEWAGGRTWWRRAFLMVLIYRPPVFLKNEHGKPFEENETHVICQKAKPKGIAKIGKASVFWDWKKNRYYCFDTLGNKLYSLETKSYQNEPEAQLSPNLNFDERIEKEKQKVTTDEPF